MRSRYRSTLSPSRGKTGSAASSTQDPGGLWVVDPIDGTACFIAGIPVWCVSIAFLAGREIELGVVHDPNADDFSVPEFTLRHDVSPGEGSTPPLH